MEKGQPRELVLSCYNMASGQGYDDAKNLLRVFWELNEIRCGLHGNGQI